MLEVRPFSPRDKRFNELVRRGRDGCGDAGRTADDAIREVEANGAEAILARLRRLGFPGARTDSLCVDREALAVARDGMEETFLAALSLARVNIRKFHEYQRQRGYVHDDGDGVRLSRVVRPLARVGICCRTHIDLLAAAVPAQVAGVGAIAVAAPVLPGGELCPKILAAAKVLDISEVYAMSGPHAVAAFCHGADPVKKVDKVVGSDGPATDAAKRLVSGLVGVDQSRGWSELVVIADDGANAKFIAADLLAEARRGAGTGVYALFTTDRLLAEAVRIEAERMIHDCGGAEGLRDSLVRCGCLFVCAGLDEAVDAANRIAPARLSLMTRDDAEYLAGVESAGAVFIGPWPTGEAGDYFAGISPLLPVGGTARFASGLGVGDFVKEIAVVEHGPERLLMAGRHMLALAGDDGGGAHVRAVEARLELLKLTLE